MVTILQNISWLISGNCIPSNAPHAFLCYKDIGQLFRPHVTINEGPTSICFGNTCKFSSTTRGINVKEIKLICRYQANQVIYLNVYR